MSWVHGRSCRREVSRYPSSKRLQLLLLLLDRLRIGLLLLKVPPAADPLVPRRLPLLLIVSLTLPLIQLLLLLTLLPPLLLHLRLHLPHAPLLIIHQHPLDLLAPLDLELVALQVLTIIIDVPFLLADEQLARVGYGFVEAFARLLVCQLRVCFLQPVEGIGGFGVLGLVRVD